jgi:hypothetical protein
MKVPNDVINDCSGNLPLQESGNGMRFCSWGFCLQIFHEKAAIELNEMHLNKPFMV